MEDVKVLAVADAPELNGLDPSKAEQIKLVFLPMSEMLSNLEGKYYDLINESRQGVTEELTKRAKRLRLDIVKVRTATEKVRKEQKDEYLRAGRAIDGVSNILKWAVQDKETKLKEIEDHFVILEQKRLIELQAKRSEELSPYCEGAGDRNLTSMDEDVWKAYLSTKKREYKDRIEAERKAEEERIAKEKAEAEERERVRLENERLKKEAAERKAAEEKERIEREEKLKREREAHEAEIRRINDERERDMAKERAIREKAEREAAIIAAELKARQDAEEAAAQERLNASDKSKVSGLIDDLTKIKAAYSFKSKKNQKMFSDVCVLIDKIIGHINLNVPN